jgi:formylglycine-generating enzyme required for sulfatase activity
VGSPAAERCRGDDQPQTPARIDYAFEVSALEVGQREFEQRMGFDPSFNAGCETCPVDSVTHDEAAAYCNALSTAGDLAPCYACENGEDQPLRCAVAVASLERCEGYRLPTELEWEYAARAGTQGPTYAGPITSCMGTDEVAQRIGWYKASSGGRTRPRGQKLANPWGLYDMAGNVYEWTASVVSADADAAGEGILRGGSWYHNAHHMRAASRLRVPLGRTLIYAGFRCVRTLHAAG